jgi:putative inorganic carbon (HCO3(-)) transporter
MADAAQTTSPFEWWRPAAAAPAAPAPARVWRRDSTVAARFAFGGLIAFEIVLLVAPQEQIKALAALRPALMAAGIALFGHLLDRSAALSDPLPASRTVRFAVLLLVWAIVTLPWSYWPGGTVSTMQDLYIKSLTIFWLLGRVIDRPSRLRAVAWTIALGSVPIAVSAILNYGAGVDMAGSGHRIEGYHSGMAGNPNDLALTLDLAIPFALGLARSSVRPSLRLVAAGVAAIGVIGVIVTFSRGGFVALMAIALFSWWPLIRRRPIRAVAIVAVAVVAFTVLPAAYVARLQTIGNINADQTHSAQDRWRDMGAASRFIVDHPIIGAGLGNDVLALNQMRGATWTEVHNAYLQAGVELGGVGGVLFIAMIVAAIREAYRAERRLAEAGSGHAVQLARAVRIALLAFAVGAMFYPIEYHFFFYNLAGLAVASRRMVETS